MYTIDLGRQRYCEGLLDTTVGTELLGNALRGSQAMAIKIVANQAPFLRLPHTHTHIYIRYHPSRGEVLLFVPY